MGSSHRALPRLYRLARDDGGLEDDASGATSRKWRRKRVKGLIPGAGNGAPPARPLGALPLVLFAPPSLLSAPRLC